MTQIFKINADQNFGYLNYYLVGMRLKNHYVQNKNNPIYHVNQRYLRSGC